MTYAPTIILYDGWCSVCTKTASKLAKLDNNRNLIHAVDFRQCTDLLTAHDLDPAQVRRVMHAITPDGQILFAMDALVHCMSTLGRGWLLRWTRLPIARQITDRFYLIFATHRLRWFGRTIAQDDPC